MGSRQAEPLPSVLPPAAKLRRLSQEGSPSQEVPPGRAPTSPPPLCLAGGPRAPFPSQAAPGHLSWQVSSWSLGSPLLTGPCPAWGSVSMNPWDLLLPLSYLQCCLPSVSAKLCLPPGLSQPFHPHLLPITQEFSKHSDLADSTISWFVTVA